MDLPKFLALLHTKSLHFSSAEQFEDKYEWTIPAGWTNAEQERLLKSKETYQSGLDAINRKLDELSLRKTWRFEPGREGMSEQELAHLDRVNMNDARRSIFRQELPYHEQEYLKAKKSREFKVRNIELALFEKQRGRINSWFMSENESIAMWDLYSSQHGGVAVQSSVGRLIDCVAACPQDVHIGTVTYIDFDDKSVDLPYHLSTYKRIAFKHEEELRAVIISDSADPNTDIEVNLDVLIEKVYINPRVQGWAIEPIKTTIAKFGLVADIIPSKLFGPNVASS